MTPPKDQRPRQPSRPDLTGIVTPDQPEREVVRHSAVDGAPQELPPHRKGTLTGLGAVRPSGEYAPTVPAPPNPLRHKTLQRPAPPSSVALARRSDPPPRHESPAPTGASSGPPGASLPPPSKSPEAATIEALRRRAEEAEAAKAKAERELRVQLEAKGPGPYQPPIVATQAETETKPAPVVEDEPTPRAWRAALFKVVVGLGALLTAAATILGVRANTAIEPKVETNAVRTKVVETAADTLTERVVKLEAFARAEAKRRQCVEAQLRDALARGTGHVLTTLPSEPTGWSEQNAPKNEPRLYWKSPTWFTVQGCDAAPAPP